MKAGRARTERVDRLLAGLAGLVPGWQERAILLDQQGAYPEDEIAQLHTLGAVAAAAPTAFGGVGLGTEPEGAAGLLQALRLIGRGSLSVGRLYEAHVNVFRLITRFGTDNQVRRAADDALAGRLFGLWVTDLPDRKLRLDADWMLHGAKCPCSGAGRLARALVTAATPGGETRMLLIAVPPGNRATLGGWEAQGMRATATGGMALDGIRVDPDAIIGGPGDYLRQPDFSAGAWRTSAVTLGGLEALIAAARAALVARGRDGDPHQQARIGEALIAQETAHLWVRRAAQLAEAADGDAGDVANGVNLARLAVETACLDAMRLVQRALGLAAFRRGTLTELLLRDLATYLRQPAPDEALTEAAAHFMQRDLPEPPQWR